MTNFLINILADSALLFVLLLIIVVLLFFFIRELTLWYFKINQNTESLSRIAYALEKIVKINNSTAVKTNMLSQKVEDDELNLKVDTISAESDNVS